jgi:dolichyl-phosphate-mannose-protein mannosyltransferase
MLFFSEIAFGSNITLKNYGYGGGLLHSHPHHYPEGSKQQQVTCYIFKDGNNMWEVSRPRNLGYSVEENKDGIQYIKDGDVIRLQHVSTRRNLHSHPVNAPISTKYWEVSAYGDDENGDIQDNWRVEIVKDVFDSNAKHIKALTTRFRLRHVYMDCLLTSRNVMLPQWGFKQNEVVCDSKSKPSDPHTWWNIEEHTNSARK